MKLEELAAIRERMKDAMNFRVGSGDLRIVVAMGECGIEHGARPVLNAFAELISDAHLTSRVKVVMSGCVGNCDREPIVEVYEKGKEKVTYADMSPEKAKRVVEEHIKGGTPVAEYLL